MRLQNQNFTLLTWVILSTPLFITVGCSSTERATRKPGEVQHIVLCWLKEPGNTEARQKLIDASYKLISLPGVVNVLAGPPLPSERPVVDDSFDVGIIMVLENSDALQQYLENPVHKKAIAEVLSPLTERILIYDVVVE